MAEIERLLLEGSCVVIGQYLARPDFIEELESTAQKAQATFVEVVLDLDSTALSARLAERANAPSRPEHAVNNELVAPQDAEALIASLEDLRASRPHAAWIRAENLDSTLCEIRSLLT